MHACEQFRNLVNFTNLYLTFDYYFFDFLIVSNAFQIHMYYIGILKASLDLSQKSQAINRPREIRSQYHNGYGPRLRC